MCFAYILALELAASEAQVHRCVALFRPKVAGHDQYRVAEIDHAALTIGQASVIENLQQGVPYFRMRFLDFVEQNNAVRAGGGRLR